MDNISNSESPIKHLTKERERFSRFINFPIQLENIFSPNFSIGLQFDLKVKCLSLVRFWRLLKICSIPIFPILLPLKDNSRLYRDTRYFNPFEILYAPSSPSLLSSRFRTNLEIVANLDKHTSRYVKACEVIEVFTRPNSRISMNYNDFKSLKISSRPSEILLFLSKLR